MGYLHEGHLALVEAAREQSDTVIASLFVNPLQFDESADLDRYPRDTNRDAELLAKAGCDVLFAPEMGEMYPDPPLARVSLSGITEEMEGARRPGHFEGVATVVAKLFAGLRPDRAYFGRKDAQQLAVVTRMAADLSFPVEVIGCPTVRERDGLALSSRNVFLGPEDRTAALALSRGLGAAAAAARAGERAGAVLEGLVLDEMERTSGVDPEYAVLADAARAARIPDLDRPAFLAAAARVGPVRLIDNVRLQPDGTADLGVRLERPSILYGEGD
jgi:pantoate--beta-alanine ligase